MPHTLLDLDGVPRLSNRLTPPVDKLHDINPFHWDATQIKGVQMKHRQR